MTTFKLIRKQTQLEQCLPSLSPIQWASKVHSLSLLVYHWAGGKKKSKLLYQLCWEKKHKRLLSQTLPWTWNQLPGVLEGNPLCETEFNPTPTFSSRQPGTYFLLACLAWGLCPGVHSHASFPSLVLKSPKHPWHSCTIVPSTIHKT